MPNLTNNYNLEKPLDNETADISVINGNMDIIDTKLKEINDNSIPRAIATAANQFLVSSAVGQFVVKTIADIKSLLGLGSAAYKNTGVAGGVANQDDLVGHTGNSTVHVTQSDKNYWNTKDAARLGDYTKNATDLPNTYPMGMSITFVNPESGWHSYGTVITYRSYSGGGGTYQEYVPYGVTAGGLARRVRYGNYDVNGGNSWTAWKTVWDSGNQGSGSGLDADTVDGTHAAVFSQARGSITDANSAIADGGYLILNTAANAPFNDDWATLYVMRGGTGALMQIAVTQTGSKVAFRHFQGSYWTTWKRLWHNGITDSSSWATEGALPLVAGQLAWKNFGNNHTIFDASQSTSPSGSSINNTNSSLAWMPTYPTLMGFNGAQTYGVRVDSARNADTVAGMGFASSTGRGLRAITTSTADPSGGYDGDIWIKYNP